MILSGLSLIMIIASIPALIIAAAGHEYAHAKAADLLGDPTPVSYTHLHKQLRDMIEYVDFDNTRTLQKEPQWRVDGTYKKQLEANSVYIPWYMKKIALYN